MCQHHFDAEATNIHHKKGMSKLEYDKEVPFYNELEKITGTTNDNVPQKTIGDLTTYAESDDWKHLPKYDDIMQNEIVDY